MCMNNFFLSVFTSSPLPRPQDAVVEGGVLLLPLSTVLFFILFFYLLYLHNPRCGYTRYGHCHHLSVECLALAPTGKSCPPLCQEMQEAFRPEHMRQEAECARVDFPCFSLKQDLRNGKMMTMTLYPPQRGFLHCSTGTASATLIFLTFCLAMTLELSNFQKCGIALLSCKLLQNFKMAFKIKWCFNLYASIHNTSTAYNDGKIKIIGGYKDGKIKTKICLFLRRRKSRR